MSGDSPSDEEMKATTGPGTTRVMNREELDVSVNVLVLVNL